MLLRGLRRLSHRLPRCDPSGRSCAFLQKPEEPARAPGHCGIVLCYSQDPRCNTPLSGHRVAGTFLFRALTLSPVFNVLKADPPISSARALEGSPTTDRARQGMRFSGLFLVFFLGLLFCRRGFFGWPFVPFFVCVEWFLLGFVFFFSCCCFFFLGLVWGFVFFFVFFFFFCFFLFLGLDFGCFWGLFSFLFFFFGVGGFFLFFFFFFFSF